MQSKDTATRVLVAIQQVDPRLALRAKFSSDAVLPGNLRPTGSHLGIRLGCCFAAAGGFRNAHLHRNPYGCVREAREDTTDEEARLLCGIPRFAGAAIKDAQDLRADLV